MNKKLLEQKAEESFNSKYSCSYGNLEKMTKEECWEEGWITCAKENCVVWHDLRKDTKDLPNDSRTVFTVGELGDMKDIYSLNNWLGGQWDNSDMPNLKIIAWTEIPQFRG